MPEKAQHGAGISMGRLAFLFLKKRRMIALSNLRRVFRNMDDKGIGDIAEACFERLGINFVESILMPYVSREDRIERFTIENKHYMDDALSMGKGVIALVFHYGNWEIMGVTSLLLQEEVVALARPLKRHVMLNNFLNKLRSATGLKIIPNANTGRDIFRLLRENKIVAILGDQREKRSAGVYVDFFGEKVPTNRGIATIGMKTGAPVIPVFPVREGFLRYRVVFNEPLVMEKNGNIHELIEKNTRKINAFLETIILKNPEEWFWVHRRWGRNA